MPARRQTADDACPGALRLHAAADGALARIRLPGGMLTGRQLRVLAEIAESQGDGALELTSRANIQLRALRADPAELADRLAGAGLLPSPAHETVRNIVAPPLADDETRALVEALDRALCADEALAGLPGRFLFAVGPTPLAADVAAVPVRRPGKTRETDVPTAPAQQRETADGAAGPAREAETAAGSEDLVVAGAALGAEWAVLLGGTDVGVRVPADRVVVTMLEAAHGFLAERAGREPRPWRLREIPGGAGLVAARLAAAGVTWRSGEAGRDGETADSAREAAREEPAADDAREAAPTGLVGRLEPAGGGTAVGVLVPLGRLTGVHLKVLARADRLAVTPGGGVVVRDLAPEAADRWIRDLQAAGLVTESDSKWVGVTTCAGRPGCGKALADVRRDAAGAAAFVDGLPVHWVGCERGCGSPAGPHVRVEAGAGGYRVDGVPVEGDLGEVVAARRA